MSIEGKEDIVTAAVAANETPPFHVFDYRDMCVSCGRPASEIMNQRLQCVRVNRKPRLLDFGER